MPDKAGNLFAAVFGTVILDTGEIAKDEKGNAKLDEEGNQIPILENIDTIVPLNANPQFRSHIQAFLTEAITLKNLKIAEKNGQISHFLEAVGDAGGAMKAKEKEVKAKKVTKKVTKKSKKDETKEG